MSHDVEIDHERIDQGFAEFEAMGAGGSRGTQQEFIPAETENPWKNIAAGAASFLSQTVAPNWEIPQAHEDKWAAALADVLQQMFPGGLGAFEEWGPWSRLAFASGLVCVNGVDFETYTLKPLQVPGDEPPGGEGAGPGSDEPAEKKPFTTAVG